MVLHGLINIARKLISNILTERTMETSVLRVNYYLLR